eukprot:TRINITY_DN1296_c1_g1_i1.p1 TRINITY_DN1296_c1_g1~~TRINITY_DN1296_c1_g1_i1.p1  ORF type:complete len:332 (-),score=73.04 TRINITY_DN1296_c1_g1_i1:84-1079(-)
MPRRAVVASAVVVAVLSCVAYFVVCYPLFASLDQSADLLRAVQSQQMDRSNTVVVVPGAWRRPRLRDATTCTSLPGRAPLSRVFRGRLERAVEVVITHGFGELILTGGRSEAIDARTWVIARFHPDGPLIPEVSHFAINTTTTTTANDLAPQHVELAIGNRRAFVTIHVEDESTTTSSNAYEVARLLHSHNNNTTNNNNNNNNTTTNTLTLQSIRNVVIVSSAYHLLRCRIIFTKALLLLPTATNATNAAADKGRWQVYTIASFDQFELVVPDPAMGVSWLHTATLWIGHLRFSLVWSLPLLSSLRELGALVVNVTQGKYSASELVQACLE